MNEYAYLTKYAASSGKIQKLKIRDHSDGVCIFLEGLWGSFKVGKDCFLTEPEAIAACEEARIKKLKSLDKQIKHVSALTYKVVQ